VNSFIKSVPLLIDAMLICGFYFMIFGICGLSVFIGEYRKRCFDRETGSLVEDIEFTCGGTFFFNPLFHIHLHTHNIHTYNKQVGSSAPLLHTAVRTLKIPIEVSHLLIIF